CGGPAPLHPAAARRPRQDGSRNELDRLVGGGPAPPPGWWPGCWGWRGWRRSGGRGCWVADELANGGGEFVGVGERGEVIQLGQGLRARIGQHLGQGGGVLAERGARAGV